MLSGGGWVRVATEMFSIQWEIVGISSAAMQQRGILVLCHA